MGIKQFASAMPMVWKYDIKHSINLIFKQYYEKDTDFSWYRKGFESENALLEMLSDRSQREYSVFEGTSMRAEKRTRLEHLMYIAKEHFARDAASATVRGNPVRAFTVCFSFEYRKETAEFEVGAFDSKHVAQVLRAVRPDLKPDRDVPQEIQP